MIARSTTGWRPYALLSLLCLALYLPGIAALPPFDRDEARFAQATRQMVESGDLLRIRFLDEARNKKPVGIYWLQAASVAALSNAQSTAIWPYRLPSLVGATIAVLLTFGLGSRLVGRAAALGGAALLSCALGVVAEAHLAKTDAVLLATVVAAQGALGAIYLQGRRVIVAPWPWALMFWAAQGVGLLIKGPVTPLVSLLTMGALSLADRDALWLKALRPLWGVPLMAAIAAPWFIAITVVTNGAFLGEAVGHDLGGKLVAAQEAHGGPPGYYLLLLAVTFWPGSLLLGPALTWAWRERRAPAVRFLIAWIVPFWMVVELMPTKLPHYILPAYPALALLGGGAVVALGEGALARRRWLDGVTVALWTVVSLAFAGGLALLPQRFGQGVDIVGVAAAALLLNLGGWLIVAAWRGGPALVPTIVALALVAFVPAFHRVVPELDRLWLSREAAAMVARDRAAQNAPLAAVGYHEPSLVFLLGSGTRLLVPDAAADYVTSRPGALALVSDRDDAAFRSALRSRGWHARAVDHVEGTDYSNGQRMTLTLYTGVPG